MKTFYQFLTEAPQQPPAGGPNPPAGGPASPPGGPSLGGGPSPIGGGAGLGGPPMGGGAGLGGPPMGGAPSLGGGLGGPTGGDPTQPQGQINVQKSKPLSVWQALEKIVQAKNGQNQNKMVNSEQS